jgi:hypothetical protein
VRNKLDENVTVAARAPLEAPGNQVDTHLLREQQAGTAVDTSRMT